MKTKKKEVKPYEYMVEDFTPSFYLVAGLTIIGMVTVLLVFIGLIVAVTKLLAGTL